MLHDALRRLTEDAARLLESRLRGGEEIPFEVGETGTSQQAQGTALFAYKPMTADFVASHADLLRELPSFENAANQLARTRGTVAYLRLRNEPILDVGEQTHARLGALAFLAAIWADAEHFEPWDERFVSAFCELESVVLAERLVTTVFIPVHGVVLDCEIVNLGAGVELMAIEDLDADCLDRFSDAAEGADCYCAVSVDAPSNAPAPMAAVRQQARSLLTALRMFKPGSVSLGLTAQANVGGSWQQVSLPFTGRTREEAWRLLPGEDEELRQFIGAVRRIDRRTRVAWALKRFEMGLERSVPAEGLTDFLAALRALIEAHDDTGKAALPARVSALCARDSERVHVRATVEAAFALERLALDGHIGRSDRKRLAKQPPLEVIAETERYLRALLHDLVCGYLATDLKKLADEILLADGEPTGDETAAHDPVYLEPVPDPGTAPRTNPTATQEFEAVFDDTAEITAVDTRAEAPEGAEIVEFPIDQADDNVWTLRPASEIKPAPQLRPDPVFENPVDQFDTEPVADGETDQMVEQITTNVEIETESRMRRLAEELVDDFDEAFGRTMEDDVPTVPVDPPSVATSTGPSTERAELKSLATPFKSVIEPSSLESDDYEHSTDRTCDEASAQDDCPVSAAPTVEAPDATPAIAGLFEPPPSFTVPPVGEGRRRRDADPLPPGTERIILPTGDAAEAGFTFDFSVVDLPEAPELPASATSLSSPDSSGRQIFSAPDEIAVERDPEAEPIAPRPEAEFSVPEFELPAERGDATADADAAVDAGAQDRDFKQIMNENFTPPPRDLTERPSTPVGRNGRPHLVAIDGASACDLQPADPLPIDQQPADQLPIRLSIELPIDIGATAPVDPQRTVEFDVLSDFDDETELCSIDPALRNNDPALASIRPSPVVPAAVSPSPTSESARSHSIGPATIEFRPLVDPDTEDPDDFAGAC